MLVGRTMQIVLVGLGVLLFAYTQGAPDADHAAPPMQEHTAQERGDAQSVTILFVGDLMFDRYIREVGERDGYATLFDESTELFAQADIVVGNLEGPITTNSSVARGTHKDDGVRHFQFTFDPAVAETLGDAGIDAVSLANNHSGNFGRDGLRQTRELLRAAEVAPFGGAGADAPFTLLNRGDVSIALIGYDAFSESVEEVFGRIAAARPHADSIVVYAHWGVEYAQEPTEAQRVAARRFAEAGADVIVGAHPHVVQGSEWVGATPAYYSLGNFIFDQYWNDAVSCGLALRVTLLRDARPRIEEIPIYLDEQSGRAQPHACSIEVPALR